MCTRETPRAERAMCGCYTRRAVLTVAGTVAVVLAAVFVPSFEVAAFVAAGVAVLAVVALAYSRGAADGGLRVGWITLPQAPAAPQEAVRAPVVVPWHERAHGWTPDREVSR